MDHSQISIDLLRMVHLMCFAAGMGTAVYFDFQRFSALNKPLTAQDLADLKQLHGWISTAFGCLWITGIILIYVRTSFDISQFAPKLWMKIGIMTFMLFVSRLIGTVVIPILRDNVGRSLISMPKAQLVLTTQIGVLSMFCWTSGLLLGASQGLKTATWDVLLPLALAWLCVLSIGGQCMLMLVRIRHARVL